MTLQFEGYDLQFLQSRSRVSGSFKKQLAGKQLAKDANVQQAVTSDLHQFFLCRGATVGQMIKRQP
jgi:hypothetical protein